MKYIILFILVLITLFFHQIVFWNPAEAQFPTNDPWLIVMTPTGIHQEILDTLTVGSFDYFIFPVYSTVTGDFNGDGEVSASDVITLVNYVFRGGSAPQNNGKLAVYSEMPNDSSTIFYGYAIVGNFLDTTVLYKAFPDDPPWDSLQKLENGKLIGTIIY